MTIMSPGVGRTTGRGVKSQFTESDLVRYLKKSRDYITVFEPRLDEFNTVVGAKVVWWNDAYANVRRTPPAIGERFIGTERDTPATLMAMTEAWRVGSCVQHFEFGPVHDAWFTVPVHGKCTWMEWHRVGNYLVRSVLDLDEIEEIAKFYTRHDSLIAHTARMRAIAVERERIARNLHDTVIQNLYATALSLSLASHDVDERTEAAFNSTIESIERIIEQIRKEILDVETRQASPLRLQLESILQPIVSPTDAECDIEIKVSSVPEDIMAHVRAVCTEAASNAVRHGGASIIRMRLTRDTSELRLVIEDNGNGFDTTSSPGNGLNNMRKRAESLGGRMNTRQRALGGTEITWAVPCGEGCR